MSLPFVVEKWKASLVCTVVLLGLIILAAVQRKAWMPWVSRLTESEQMSSNEEHKHVHPPDSGHAGHSDATSLEISPEAAKNIGLTTTRIKPSSFVRTVSIPAMVVERPGRSQIEVTAPLGGRVTRIYSIEGEAVLPGQRLFEMRLTHEELVTAQSEFLRTSKELDVIQKEIDRLSSVSVAGAIPGKTMRAREYEQEKLRAVFSAREQSLLLHGLNKEQITRILQTGELIQGVTVVAPEHPENGHEHDEDHPFLVQNLTVKQGQYLDAGECLCVLADHFELYIEGRAFEEDAKQLTRAANEGWDLTAVTAYGGRDRDIVVDLMIEYLADSVDPDSRAFHFYVMLPNEIVRDVQNNKHRFASWKFKPGQRMELRVPVERWENQIVLPVDAIVDEGAETFIFEQNGDHYDRVPVHVAYRGQDQVVIANNGSLIGATVATSGAYQMQLALKNNAGGGIDPHAGHSH